MLKQTKFTIAIAVQLAIIFGLLIFKMSILSSGTDVLLKIAPVDPRDPLRGDYVVFEYDISRINEYSFGYSPIRNNDTIYVPLKQRGKYWTASYGIQKTKPVDTANIFIKGKIASGEGTDSSLSFRNTYHIIYNIEEYFIPEGAGRGVSFWNKEAYARVTIDQSGNPVLRQIFVDDKPWPDK